MAWLATAKPSVCLHLVLTWGLAQLQVKKRVENLSEKRLKRLRLRNSKIQAVEEYGLMSIKEEDF